MKRTIINNDPKKWISERGEKGELVPNGDIDNSILEFKNEHNKISRDIMQDEIYNQNNAIIEMLSRLPEKGNKIAKVKQPIEIKPLTDYIRLEDERDNQPLPNLEKRKKDFVDFLKKEFGAAKGKEIAFMIRALTKKKVLESPDLKNFCKSLSSEFGNIIGYQGVLKQMEVDTDIGKNKTRFIEISSKIYGYLQKVV